MAKKGAAETKGEIPIIVKILSVLYYVCAGMLVLLALGSFFAGGLITSYLQNIPVLNILGAIGTGLLVFLGILMLGFSVLEFFIGKGLWNGKSWARILVIVFSILGVLGSFSSIAKGSIAGILYFLYDVAVAGYLLFANEAKKFFKK